MTLNSNHKSIRTVALKWAYGPAAFGWIVGMSAAMKGSASPIGKVILGALLGTILALFLGGLTFAIALSIMKRRA